MTWVQRYIFVRKKQVVRPYKNKSLKKYDNIIANIIYLLYLILSTCQEIFMRLGHSNIVWSWVT